MGAALLWRLVHVKYIYFLYHNNGSRLILICATRHGLLINTSVTAISMCFCTVPCVAQQVEAVMVCSNDTGVVSWEEAEQVFLYSVQAFGSDGHMTLCQSDQDSCQLHPLHCGQLYDLTVSARNGECDNSHAYLQLQSGVHKKKTKQKKIVRSLGL